MRWSRRRRSWNDSGHCRQQLLVRLGRWRRRPRRWRRRRWGGPWRLPTWSGTFFYRYRLFHHSKGLPTVTGSKTDEAALIAEAFRLAELNLQSETSIALASDQRASTFCGILIAAVAILASLSDQYKTSIFDDVAMVLFVAAASLAAFVARSTKISTTGLRFDSFAEDISAGRGFSQTISELGGHYDKASEANRRLIRSNSKLFNASLILAWLGLMLAIFPQISNVICLIACQ